MSTTDDQLPPPGFSHCFRAAEHLSEDDYARFYPYLPPGENQQPHDYAKTLGKRGLAVVVTSEDARDIVRYKALVADAEARKLPIVMITAGSENDAVRIAEQVRQESPLSDPAKMAAYIEEARKTARPFSR